MPNRLTYEGLMNRLQKHKGTEPAVLVRDGKAYYGNLTTNSRGLSFILEPKDYVRYVEGLEKNRYIKPRVGDTLFLEFQQAIARNHHRESVARRRAYKYCG